MKVGLPAMLGGLVWREGKGGVEELRWGERRVQRRNRRIRRITVGVEV